MNGLHKWFKEKKIYQNYVVRYQKEGLTRGEKIKIAAVSYTSMSISGLIIRNLYVSILLFVVALIELIVLIKMRTRSEKNVNDFTNSKK